MSKSLIKPVRILIAGLALIFAVTACSDGNNNGSDGQSIAEIVQTNEDLATLEAAVLAADPAVLETLSGDGTYTLFAPTNEAFTALGDALNDLLLPENQELLTNILVYHVYGGEVLAEDAIALAPATVDMLNGLGMSIDVVGGDVVLNLNGNREAVVISADIIASNGVIHVIDAVLDPADAPNIVERVVANEDLATLEVAVLAADPVVVETLSGEGPYTLFAPTNEAFAALGDTLNDLLLPENQELLTNILVYHVYDGKVLAEDAIALAPATVDMLNGLGMSIDVVDGAVVLNLDGNREAVVISPDIIASNGVIHVIDAVLDPADAPNIVERVVANEDLATLEVAVLAADPIVVETLSGEGPYTLFAPTNEAFAALGDALNDLLLPENQALLTNILTYHVYEGEVLAEDAIALAPATVDMLNGLGMSIDVVDGAVVLNLDGNREAVVISPDIIASNGVIHVIDAVLNPADAPPE